MRRKIRQFIRQTLVCELAKWFWSVITEKFCSFSDAGYLVLFDLGAKWIMACVLVICQIFQFDVSGFVSLRVKWSIELTPLTVEMNT